MKRVAAASFVGTALEGYDFLLYAAAAALVFGQLFFPVGDDPLIGTLLAYSTFTVGFIARPIGGVIAGHYGDRIGRKPMLVLTLSVMGVVTMLIGFLPTYGQVGILAPILLTLLRFIQGLAYGGEWGGAILMVVEYAPANKRGFWGSLPQAAVPFGFLLATAVLSASIAISGDQFLVWGWRIPFILSILPVLVGLYIRLKISETPVFEKVKEQSATAKTPVVEAFRSYRKQILLATGVFVLVSGPYYIIISFMLSYGTTVLGVERKRHAQRCVDRLGHSNFCLHRVCITIRQSWPASGAVRRRTLHAVLCLPVVLMVNTADPLIIWAALSLGLLAFGALYGPIAAFFAELFESNVRYTAASLGYQMGQVFGGRARAVRLHRPVGGDGRGLLAGAAIHDCSHSDRPGEHMGAVRNQSAARPKLERGHARRLKLR